MDKAKTDQENGGKPLKRKYKHSLHAKGLALLLPSLMLLQAGCTAVPDGRDPLQMSSSYSRSLDSAAGYDAVRGQYWREFGDDALNKLVEEALKDNPNLERVRQRLLQAEAVAKKAVRIYTPLSPSRAVAIWGVERRQAVVI